MESRTFQGAWPKAHGTVPLEGENWRLERLLAVQVQLNTNNFQKKSPHLKFFLIKGVILI